MKVAITSSSSDNINNIYKEESKKVISFLASEKLDLVWGCGSNGIMGICYEEFKNANLNIYGYTTPKYADMLEELNYAQNMICEDTFVLKKRMFDDSDLIVCLPGGLGTISEFFSYLEEIRSNNPNKLLILYNLNGEYNYILELINNIIKENFIGSEVNNYFKVVNNYAEFVDVYNNWRNK